MPNTREKEKLIDIVCNAAQINGCIHSCNHPPCAMVGIIVDALIANGVTVQKWIPVTERLPETFGAYLVTVQDAFGKRYSDYADYDPYKLYWRTGLNRGTDEYITHWMPLPEPPRGE